MAESRKPRKRKTPAQRVEDVLVRVMNEYGESCAEMEKYGWWRTFPREHSAFFRARGAILRLLREVARG